MGHTQAGQAAADPRISSGTITLLYEAGVDPLIAMKIVGHTDYQTTANIYTHVRDEMLRKATVNLDEVFGRRAEGK